MIRRLIFCCLALACLAVSLTAILWISHGWWLNALGRYLVIDQQATQSDAIVAVAGQNRRRVHAIELYRKGLAKALVFNVSDTTYYFGQPIDPVSSVLEDLESNGISRDRAIINRDITSTWQDACITLETARRYGFASLIVVSSPLHMRRVKMSFDRVFAGQEIELTFCCVPLEKEKIELDRWWTREVEFIKVCNEYLKLTYYWFKYFQGRY